MVISSNQEKSVIFDCRAVVSPDLSGLHQVVPHAFLVDLTAVLEAGHKFSRDNICSRFDIHAPGIIFQLATPPIGIDRRPELNRSVRRCWHASNDQDTWRWSWTFYVLLAWSLPHHKDPLHPPPKYQSGIDYRRRWGSRSGLCRTWEQAS